MVFYFRPSLENFCQPLQPKHQYAYSPNCSVYISYGSDKESNLGNRELVKEVFLSFIPMTFPYHSGVIQWVEIRR